jgi:hypothetical protein
MIELTELEMMKRPVVLPCHALQRSVTLRSTIIDFNVLTFLIGRIDHGTRHDIDER